MASLGEIELEWWPPGTIPAPASIVWCAFPDHIRPDQPGPKPRPGLVFKVRQADNPPQNRFLVQVAYGTSKLKSDKRPFDFFIANFVDRLICRLPQATRFDLDNIVWLPWAKPYFIPRAADQHQLDTPVITVLPDELQRNLGWLMQVRDQHNMNAPFRRDP